MYYSGVDLHSDNCYITTLDDSGAVIKQQRIKNISELILDYFHSLPGSHQAVVESTTGWYWLNDLLQDNGIELVLAHAKYLKAISYAKVKTDKVDSQTLATLLRQDLIPRAHKISRELRGLRDTMRIRLRLVQQRSACLLRLNSVHMKFNGSVPDPYHFQLAVLEHSRDNFTAQILALEKSLHPVLIPNDDIQRLLYIPGSENSLRSPSTWRSMVSNASHPISTLLPIADWSLLPITPIVTYTIAPAKTAINISRLLSPTLLSMLFNIILNTNAYSRNWLAVPTKQLLEPSLPKNLRRLSTIY